MLELLSDIVKIDESKPNFDQAKMNEIDEGYVDNNSMLLFQMKAASVYSYDLLNQRQHEIEQLKEIYMAKLMPLSKKSLLVLGGQTTEKIAEGVTKVKKTVTELYWNEFTS